MTMKTKPFYLFGIPINNLSVQYSFYQQGMLYRTDDWTTFQITLDNSEHIARIKRQMMNWNLQTVGLGHGVQCSYCSHYNPVGTSICIRCGGLTEVIEYVKPEVLTVTLLETAINCCVPNDRDIIEFSFGMKRDDFSKLYHAIRSDLYYADSIELGLYVCEFCGSVVREGDDCHNCGGVRLPFSELVRIDHNCLYCGSKIRGNLFCNSCGASISGETIRG